MPTFTSVPDPGRSERTTEEAEHEPSPAVRAPAPDAAAGREGRLHAAFRQLGEDLRRAESAVADLVRDRTADDGLVHVETIDGPAAQARRILELETGARHTFQVFLTGLNTVTPVPKTLTPASEAAPEYSAAPGTAYQLLVDRDFLAEPAAVAALEERVRRGEQVRVIDSPLMKMAIADGEVAMVQLGPERVVLLRQPLTMLATELFATAWRHGRPYLREVAELAPLDRQILQLMLSGLTDAATAKQLGTSPRTVQRRLRALMDLAAVTSRLQLGWYAMRNNWM
ncbi:helix-turn-helix transcriptional regulator [Streptomyces sp. NPDC002913]